MPGDEVRSQYRRFCWDNAIHAFATSYIFQRRARHLHQRLLWLTYVGTAVPLIIGIVALTYGSFDAFGVVIVVGAIVLLPQAVINLWAIVGNWVEQYSYANTSASANDALAAGYRHIGANPPADTSSLKREYDVLHAQDESRREQDLQHHIRDGEKRMGMRAALRQFRRPCAGCGEVPISMEPSDCGICGRFTYRES